MNIGKSYTPTISCHVPHCRSGASGVARLDICIRSALRHSENRPAPLADIYGRRPVVIVSVLSIGLAMTATGLVDSLWQLVAARLITGLGIGAMLASLTSSVAEYTPDRQRNLAIGIVQAGYSLGAVSGGLIAAQVIPEFGWRAVFFGGGALTAATAIACIFLLPESMQFLVQRRPANALNKLNQVLLRLKRATLTALPAPPAEKPPAPTVAALLVPERFRTTGLLWGAFCMAFATIYFVLSWLPKLLVDAGLSLDNSIYVSVATNLGGALGMVVLGRLSVIWGLSRLILIFLLAGAVGMVLFAYASATLSVPMLLLLTSLIGFFALGGFVSLYSVAARVYPSEIRTTGVGWAIGLGRVGAIIGPYVGGILISLEFSIASIFLIFAVPLVISGICAISIRDPGLAPAQAAVA